MECEFCQNHEQGDTLYEPSDWDGGIGFDYIRDIKYCPLCGSLLDGEAKDEPQTCSFSDCDNFKNPDYERCIECKRKQIKLKTEPQTETSTNSEKIQLKVQLTDEPQTDCAWK